MKRPFLAVFLLFVSLPVFAWTRNADQRIAMRSEALAPPDLRLVIERFHDDYVRGLERASASEGGDIRQAKLRARIETQAKGIVKMIRSGEPMSGVVEQLGVLVHLVGDANNPYHVGADDPDAHHDFETYFERRLPRFADVFYGLDPHFTLTSYLDSVFARTTKLGPLMSEEYSRGGERHTSADFDDRSTAFGVASVCYSHAITDTVNLYYFIWKEAGGAVKPPPHTAAVLHAN